MKNGRCCHLGKVRPADGPTLPSWLQDLWLGPVGQAEGEDGLMRSALRKFARPISNALALASQTVSARQFGGNSGRPAYNPSVVLEGRVLRRVGGLLDETDEGVDRQSYAQMYVHDAMYAPQDDSDEVPSLSARVGRIFTGVRTSRSNSANNSEIRYYCYYWGDRIFSLNNSNLELLLAISSYYSSYYCYY